MKHLITRFFGAVVVLGLASAPASAQSGANGDWELTLETPQGASTLTLTLKMDGDQATGSVSSPMGSMPVTGMSTDGIIALTGNLDLQGMSLQLGVNAKVAGDAINGTVKIGDFGEFPFTGKRAGSAAPGAAAAAGPAPAAAPAAAGTGAAGKWNITIMLAGIGEFPLTADLKQDGTDVTGMFSSAAGEVAVKGTMIGTSLKLEFTAETPQGALPITMTGELGANGGFTGKASIAGMGEADWTGVRGQ